MISRLERMRVRSFAQFDLAECGLRERVSWKEIGTESSIKMTKIA